MASNAVPVTVVRNGEETVVESRHVMTGDIIRAKKGEKFTVDCIVVSSSYDDGTVFIETAELDGETNLKRRSAVNVGFTVSNGFKGVVECEKPNENLHAFEGRVNGTKPEPLGLLNLCPRGSVLRNTDWVYAIVVYTGKNTKIIKNLKQSVQKQSRLDRDLNRMVIGAFLVNLAVLIVSVLLEYVHYSWAVAIERRRKDAGISDYAAEWYLGPRNTNTSIHIAESVLSFFGMYTYCIPISLFVTLELVRLGQAFVMQADPKMKSLQIKNGVERWVPMRAANSNLNEDLGRVEYIFSDKTGTFTRNSMLMAKWFVGGQSLDEMETPGALQEAAKSQDQSPVSEWVLFSRALALCHGVIPALDEKTNELIYESQSPDETALLLGIKANGYKLLSRTKSNMEIEIHGKKHSFEILDVVEFNSTRKRMSVIIRTEQGIHLYCKGADNIMIDRLSSKDNDQKNVESAKQALTDFGNVGLRTLVVCYKPLTEDEYTVFKGEYEAAQVSLDGRDEKMDAASASIETDFIFLGCTAIEDLLQDQLPETIEYLLKVNCFHLGRYQTLAIDG